MCPIQRLLKANYHHGDLRNALVTAALKLLEKEGTADFSLRELAKRLGVSAPALYTHFADKDALLVAVAVAGFAKLKAALEAAVQQNAEPEAQFLAMGRAYVQFGVAHPALYRLMFAGEELPAKREQFPELQEAGNAAFRALTGMLVAMQQSGFMRAGNTDLDGFTIWAHVHGLTSLVITGRVECVGDCGGIPMPSTDEMVGLSLQNLLQGFLPATR